MSRRVMVGVGCAVAVAAGVFAGPASAQTAHGNSASGQVFFLTNNAAGNSIGVYDRGDDGALLEAGTYATGGIGGALGDSSDGDQLASQGSLTYDRERRLLYAVNAGSDSLTVFALDGDRLRRLQVTSSGGTFPVSVAVRGSIVYVLNARDGGSVQGFVRAGGRLIRVPQWHRALGLDTSLTPEFLATPGQVAFTPAGDKLVVTTKNNDKIEVFNLDPLGRPSGSPVTTADAGVVPFSVTFDAAGHLDVAEAAGSVSTFVVNRDGSLTFVGRQATQQAATCWVTSVGDHVFASNTGGNSVSRYVAGSGGLTGLGLTATDVGPGDSAASSDGHELYIRAGGAGKIDEFAIGGDSALIRIGSIATPGGVGGQGIAAT